MKFYPKADLPLVCLPFFSFCFGFCVYMVLQPRSDTSASGLSQYTLPRLRNSKRKILAKTICFVLSVIPECFLPVRRALGNLVLFSL